MDIFTQNKILIRTIVVLIVMNVASIGLFIFKEIKPNHEPLLFPKNEEYKDVSGILKTELNLTDKQAIQFNQIRKRNFEKQAALKQIIRDNKDAMNVEMFNKNSNLLKIKFLSRQIAENEYKMEMLRFDQAQELKAVCNENQLEKFQDLVLEIRDYFRPDNQPIRK